LAIHDYDDDDDDGDDDDDDDKILWHPGLVQMATSLFLPTLIHLLLCY
jgi:hypothetical protein